MRYHHVAELTAVALGCAMHTSVLRAQVPAYAASVGTELDSATAHAVSGAIDAARARGLPTEPLLAKVREGRLKRAPASRIRTAVAALAVRLDSARAALGAGATADEIAAGADAIAAGASTTALRTLRGATGRQPMTAALGALAQLVASGVPEHRAVTMLMELMRRSSTPAQMLAFGNAVEYDVSTGLPGDEAALFHLRRMESGADAGQSFVVPSASALQNAGESKRPPPGSTPSTPPRRRP